MVKYADEKMALVHRDHIFSRKRRRNGEKSILFGMLDISDQFFAIILCL